MRRREFLGALGSAVAIPLAAHAQQPTLPVIGYLTTGTPEADAYPFLAAFHQGLREMGYAEGRNVAIEYRWAEFRYDRLSTLAANLANNHKSSVQATRMK